MNSIDMGRWVEGIGSPSFLWYPQSTYNGKVLYTQANV